LFVGVDFKSNALAYSLLLLFVLGKSFVHIFIKQLSKDKHVVLFYSIFYYVIFSAIPVFFWYKQFDAKMLLNLYIISLAAMSILCQLAMIQAYKMAKKISLLQNLDYSRIIFSTIIVYFMFDEAVKINQLAGMAVVFCSIFFSSADGAKYKWLMNRINPRYFKKRYRVYRNKKQHNKFMRNNYKHKPIK
jgi:drug/metabolite transporter (DMT)-like permease